MRLDRRELRESKHRLRSWPHRAARKLRKGYYTGALPVGRLPVWLRRELGLDDPSAVGCRRIEIGSGPYPQPGYLHVDTDPRASHLEARAPAWRLPFSTGWAQEILAVHALEHVEPRRLVATLREWHRVLAPGGFAQVHVPNIPELMDRFADCPVGDKWKIMGAVLGMYCHPAGVRAPEDLIIRADHQLLFDEAVLRWAFETAGFTDVANLTGVVGDSHTAAWQDVVPHFSLIFRAVR